MSTTDTNFRKPQATKPVCNDLEFYKGDTDDEWSQQIEVSESQRVMNLAPADYQENSELMRSLTLAVASLCKQMALRQLSAGE